MLLLSEGSGPYGVPDLPGPERSFLLPFRSHGRGDHMRSFQALVQTIAADTGALPDAATYRRPCDPICKCSPPEIRVLEARLLRYYSLVVKEAPVRPAVIGVLHIFIKHVFVDHTSHDVVTYIASLETALAQSGPHLPSQTFTLWTDSEEQGSTILAAQEAPYHEMLRRHGDRPPLDTGGMGAYRHVSERELTELVLGRLLQKDALEVRHARVSVTCSLLDVQPARWDPSWSIDESHDYCLLLGEKASTSFDLNGSAASDDESVDFLDRAMAGEGLNLFALPDYDLLADWLSELDFGAPEPEPEEDGDDAVHSGSPGNQHRTYI
jgi:hypothetical protein